MLKTGHVVRHTFRLSGKAVCGQSVWSNYELEREIWLYCYQSTIDGVLGWKVQRAAGRDQRAVGSLTYWSMWYVRGLGGDRQVVAAYCRAVKGWKLQRWLTRNGPDHRLGTARAAQRL